MKKTYILFLSILLLLMVTGCSSKPLEVNEIQEELENYLTRNLMETDNIGNIKTLDFEIVELVNRETDKSKDEVVFKVRTREVGLPQESNWAGSLFPYTEVKVESLYSVDYRKNSNKEWYVNRIDKKEVLYSKPMYEIKASHVEEWLKNEHKSNKLSYNAKVKDNITDINKGFASFTVSIEEKTKLYRRNGDLKYTLSFNKDNNRWDIDEILVLNPDNWECVYTISNEWIYNEKQEDTGNTVHIAFKAKYNQTENKLNITLVPGVTDKYDRPISKGEEHYWYGYPSKENPLIFVSDNSGVQVSISDDGNALIYDGRLLQRVR